METGNPGFAGPAVFQGRQVGAEIFAGSIVVVPDTQTLPRVAAAASCLDFPRLTKEAVGFCPLISPT